uniref:Nucleotidyltransferase domain-containing protein n=1 Tax=Candidatus Kentrum sp. MB TaxID=2138164 RepID=A0A450XRP0_9GAMM|nr:MAG: Nucleotidyltransferase domain-containing protein [Candidatus Kentron sp. MB]VFK34981.1 MAG: Nucleotidyltransferase domain-containing protein [Candidatus Kentron sp. MB]VFK77099.1 MAG: Nucleotidyltransferase domain-containing protein [Candidatus Kentron sp. MB]
MMNGHRLNEREMGLLVGLFRRHREIEQVILFGSRAKGNARPNSDIDLAIVGICDDLAMEALARELEALPLPYRFDLKSLTTVRHRALREHIERVGIVIHAR